MIEIKCPRCKQYWYDDDDAEGGRVRLCSRCVDQLRLERGHRAEIDIPFLIGVGVFLVFDLIMIALTALMPAVLGKVTLILGLIMSFVGGGGLVCDCSALARDGTLPISFPAPNGRSAVGPS
jgi:hypothetical protein